MPEEALRNQIIQQARNCANYTTDGYCAMNGRFCSPLTDRYAIRAGGIDCDHYFTHVLPKDGELHKAVMRELEQEPGEEYIHARTDAQKARGSNVIPFPGKPSNTIRDAITAPLRERMNALAKQSCASRQENISCAQTNRTCLFEQGLACTDFLENVLPMDAHLQKEFQDEVKRATGKPYKKNGSKKNPLLNEHREAVRALAKRECANCNGGYCLPADKPCSPITARGELCAYFRDCVLPLDKVLQAKVTAKAYKQRDRIKPCAACGKTFFASGNRAKYCEACRKERAKKQRAKWAKDRYWNPAGA